MYSAKTNPTPSKKYSYTKLPGSSLWHSLLHLTSPSSSFLLHHPILFLSHSSSPALFASAMRIIASINPFRSRKKSPSISRSDQSSFSSGTSSSSDSSDSTHHRKTGGGSKTNGSATPTSVLPTHSISIPGCSESSSDFYELEQAFKVIDRDGDGKITRADLGALLRRVGAEPLSEEELSVMLSEVDRDGDGCISLEEFGAISSAFGPPAGDAELREAFDFFDTDHDGKITAEELLCVFTSIGDGRCTLEDCRRMISDVDENNDGFVCFEDFTKMMGLQR